MQYELTPRLLGSANNRQIQRTNKLFLASLLSLIHDNQHVASEQQYNHFLANVIAIARKQYMTTQDISLFSRELDLIEKNKSLTEKTVWGGVNLKRVDVGKNFIQKLLVIKQYGILGFELHEHKHEKLKILEGECLVLYSHHHKLSPQKRRILVSLGIPGSRFEFQPGDEHGIIALTDCVIRETSTNHLDDLVYIFPSQQVLAS